MSKLRELEACCKLDENLEEQLCQLYQAENHPPFSYVIRTYFADWIEKTNWVEERGKDVLLSQLIEQIENYLDKNILSTLLKIQLRDAIYDLKTHYDERKETFARDVAALLNKEQYLLDHSHYAVSIGEEPRANILHDIKQEITVLKQHINENNTMDAAEMLHSINNVLTQLHEVDSDGGDELDDVFTQSTSLLIHAHNILQSRTDYTDVSAKFHEMLLSHLNKSIVVDESLDDRVRQVDRPTWPPMRVRFLGGKVIKDNISQASIQVVTPTKDCSVFIEAEDMVAETSFCLNDSGACEAVFPALKVACQQREGHNGDILFQFIVSTTVSLCHQDFQLQTYSAPNLLTTAHDTVMLKGSLWWCDSFSRQKQQLISHDHLLNPPSITFQHLATALSSLFFSCTGKHLHRKHFIYLAKRLFRSTGNTLEHFNNNIITHELFVKNPLPKKELSCWQWLHACICLLKTLNVEWRQGLIYGMMSKEEARRAMQGCPRGTFLLRFSESCLPSSTASLSVAVIQVSSTDGQLKIFHIRDYLSSIEIHHKGLANILYSMQVDDGDGGKRRLCEYLWPNLTPFLTLFGSSLKNHPCRRLTINIDLNEDAGKKNRVQLKSRNTCSSSRGSAERFSSDDHWGVDGHFRTPSCTAIQVFASVHQPHSVPTAMVRPQVPHNGTTDEDDR